MMLSYFARRWIVSISIIMLLLCQTAAAAFACTPAPVATSLQMAAVDATAPCHQGAHEFEEPTPAHGCQDRCPSRDASLDKGKIDIPAAAMLVLTLAPVHPPDAGATVNARYEQIVAVAAPPPLLLVYCRLLI